MCEYYEPIVENVVVDVWPDGEPIYGEELIGEICHKLNTHDFKCEGCEEYKARELPQVFDLPF